MNYITTLVEKIFGYRGRRFLLFLFSYMLAVLVLIAPLIVDPIESVGPIEGYFIGLFIFPMGFGCPIFNANFPSEGIITLILGWLSYLIITVFAIAKNNKIAKILYLIFVILLILNIGGCTIGKMTVT